MHFLRRNVCYFSTMVSIDSFVLWIVRSNADRYSMPSLKVLKMQSIFKRLTTYRLYLPKHEFLTSTEKGSLRTLLKVLMQSSEILLIDEVTSEL